MGRRALPVDRALSERINLRVTTVQRATIEVGATAAGMSLTDFVRTAAVDAAKATIARHSAGTTVGGR